MSIHISGQSSGKKISYVKVGEGKSVASLEEAESHATKKCKRCGVFYKDYDKEACVYHPGEYFAVDFQNGRNAGWSCCRKDYQDANDSLTATKMLEQSKPGCARSSRHLEDQSFSETLKHFPVVASSDELKKSKNVVQDEEEEEESTLKSKDKVEEEKVVKEKDGYIVHEVQDTDTLVGIGLRYKVSVGELQRINRLGFSSQLWGRKTILIPKTEANKDTVVPKIEETEELKRRKKIRAFMTQCNSKEVDSTEAEIYLDEDEWDVEKAVEHWKQDQQWSADHVNVSPSERERHAEQAKKKKQREYEGGFIGKTLNKFSGGK